MATIKKVVSFPDKKKPVKFVRPIVDEKGQSVRNLLISDDCELYDIDEWNKHDYFGDCPQSSLAVYHDSHNRMYASVNDNSADHKRRQHLARVAKRAFDDPKHDDEFYKTHQIDHVNPSIPLDNNVFINLEWVTNAENMYRAGKTGVMFKKYTNKQIEEICQMIIDGVPRLEIIERTGIDDGLLYDIRIGKSHRYITEKFLDKGFKYLEQKHRDIDAKKKAVHRACELIVESDLTLREMSEDPIIKGQLTEKDLSNIRRGVTYKYISEKYNINYDNYLKGQKLT